MRLLIALALVASAAACSADNPIRNYKEWRNETLGPPNPYGAVHMQHGLSAGMGGGRIWQENRGGRTSLCNNIGGTVNCQ